MENSKEDLETQGIKLGRRLILGEIVSPAVLKKVIDVVLKRIDDLKKHVEGKIEGIGLDSKAYSDSGIEKLEELVADVEDLLLKQIEKNESKSQKELKAECKELSDLIEQVQKQIPDEVDLEPLYEELESIRKALGKIPKETAQTIAEKLNKEEGIIEQSVIIGLQDALRKIAEKGGGKVVSIGGRTGVFLYVDGAKKGIQNTFNLKAGTNTTLGYSTVNGLPTITINSTAGGSGFTELSAVGAVDGSNVAFSFSQVPSYIVADGIWLKELDSNGQAQWSAVGLNITMVNPPASSIYGIA